jgi:hypothetical protein
MVNAVGGSALFRRARRHGSTSGGTSDATKGDDRPKPVLDRVEGWDFANACFKLREEGTFVEGSMKRGPVRGEIFIETHPKRRKLQRSDIN